MLLPVIRRNLLTFSIKPVSCNLNTVYKTPETILLTHNLNLLIKRYKSKKKSLKSQNRESGAEDETSSENETEDRHSKVIKTTLSSLRMDSVLKSGLGMARNKIDTLFYESKIRVNGEKVLKKSKSIQEGDEIDVIKGVDMKNPNFLVIARVEVVQAQPQEDNIKVKLRRNKSLIVENYKEPWKGGPESA
ncbi:mitochondrial transcription rescue factor 1 [Onthophagus taurus]|uniref:mitochondrial transcription rescue factor 1 n=1 Tax=Onthophagus taurus TaxID=166361 RepID=UPI0039BEC10A